MPELIATASIKLMVSALRLPALNATPRIPEARQLLANANLRLKIAGTTHRRIAEEKVEKAKARSRGSHRRDPGTRLLNFHASHTDV